jgi:signal transduction histidine kinase
MNKSSEGFSRPPQNTPEAASLGLQRRLAFLELTAEDRTRLHELAEALGESAGAFVKGFYQHLFAFPDTARFLQQPELVERLKVAQQRHMESMLAAEWDAAYVARRRRVGDQHAQAGILPEHFLGAYLQYVKHCLGQMAAQHGRDVADWSDKTVSLLKVIFLDIGLTLDAYFEQATHGLRQALELLLRANAELRQFAHLTSHDLKTPLATVANLCDETIDEFGDQMPQEARKLIEAARNRVFRMSATIDDLLSSTISTGAACADEEVATYEIIAEILEQLRPALVEKGIETTVEPDLPPVIGDHARTREALYNILSNAIKFIDKRPGRIAVDAHRRDGQTVISIADNGPGIRSEDLDRIFLPFQRLSGHGDIPGSGLGLYFTKTLVEQQGGQVWAESKLGEGSRFFIALPCRDLQAPPR